MSHERAAAEWRRTPKALEPRALAAIDAVIARRQRGEPAPAKDMQYARAVRDDRDSRKTMARNMVGGIAVLTFYGVIFQRAGLMTEYSGGTSCQQLTAALRDAVTDESIGQIILDFDTPGGTVFGIQELYAEIFQARQSKPIIGIANSQCASAGYWLASACTELYCTPGGEVGSIGVWQQHDDISQAMEEAGVKTTLISAGKYKTEANPYGPLDADARSFLQQRTDEYYRAFTAAVARGRGVPVAAVRNGMGQGRMLGADQALSEKMIDGICTLDQLIGKLQANRRNTGTASKAGPPTGQGGGWRRAAMQREIEILELGCSAPPRNALDYMRQEVERLSK